MIISAAKVNLHLSQPGEQIDAHLWKITLMLFELSNIVVLTICFNPKPI